MKKLMMILSVLLITTLLLTGCRDHDFYSVTVVTMPGEEQQKEDARVDGLEEVLRADMPKTDGSTSTLPLDIAVHSAILGIPEKEAALTVKHTKTYTSLENLADGKCDFIIRTPVSDGERERIAEKGIELVELPVSCEGFVFVVNKNNPIDALTEEQLRDIYSGKITNWKEVGGNDLPIIPYQRNSDSGSQNYMVEFMGDTPLMAPVTEPLPAAMSGILNAIANYDNAEGAIGYSVYAYSDGMYEDIAKIKYIKVNGVEPSFENMANKSYPLLSYNYAVFRASEPEGSPARVLADWMQSDRGQQIATNAGYVPYRDVVGLELPQSSGKIYSAVGTGKEMTWNADYYYELKNLHEGIPEIKDGKVNKIIQDYIISETERINTLHDAEFDAFLEQRKKEGYGGTYYYPAYRPSIEYTVKNGYLSILSGMWWNEGAQYSPDCYYKPAGAVFDLYTGERLELSDLFPKEADFVPELNRVIKDKLEKPAAYSLGGTYETVRDFYGLMENEFIFTADSLIFTTDRYLKDGVILSLKELREDMVISEPRNMEGLFKTDDKCIYKVIYDDYYPLDYCTPVEFANGSSENDYITYYLLTPDNGFVSNEVSEKINSFVLELHENYFTPEKLLERARAENIDGEIEKYSIGPMPDAEISVIGDRYAVLNGANILFAYITDGKYKEISVLPNAYSQFYYAFYFDIQTGEELTVDDLFADGFIKHTEVKYVPKSTEEVETDIEMTAEELLNSGKVTITMINNYSQAPNKTGEPSDNNIPVTVTVIINDTTYNLYIPREFIK